MAEYRQFKDIQRVAMERKGGEAALRRLLPKPVSKAALLKTPDDRVLAEMTKAINRAGFNWQVIENKWPQFEEAYFGFDLQRLAALPQEAWEAYASDKRVVRNWPKIKAVQDNVSFILSTREQHGSFARFLADWPSDDQIGLMAHLKKHGSRLGGQTGQWFLRMIGWDGFIMTADVIAAIQRAGYAIADQPTSKRDLLQVQAALTAWKQASGLSYTQVCKIAAYSIGENYDAEFIQTQMSRFS